MLLKLLHVLSLLPRLRHSPTLLVLLLTLLAPLLRLLLLFGLAASLLSHLHP
jgi:hypothetical protein